MLKQKAFPSKFPGLSTYLSKAVPKERKGETGFQKRFENAVSRHNKKTQTFFKAHNIECFEEIQDKLAGEILPQGVVTLLKNEEELILGKVVRDHEGTPEIQFSIVIQRDLSFQLFNGRSSLSLNAVKHIQVGNQIKNVNVLVNILAFMKSVSEKDNYDHDQIHALLNQLKNEINKNNEDSCLQKQLFALEQLQLAPKSTKQKRYSPGLTALAVLWFKTSPCLYKQLRNEGILSLPSVKHVQRLSRALRVESGVSDATVKYLEQRAINLSSREKCVILIMDEMYVAQKLEYFNGRFYGQQEGEFTKTLLGLMIKSLGGKYSDMVALTEISKLNAAKLKVEFMRVMQAVTNCGFDVVATSVDGHIINVKFYKDICKGDLKLSITHPVSKEVNAKLFLLFDSVHIFKNVLNNFINAREFHLPPFDGREIGVAKFSHLEELYHVECGKPLKMAYKLSETCLHPSSLERTNVKLADAIFHESTVGALRFYGTLDKPAWLATAAFLEIIRRWFDIVNVKTMSKGYKKRSEFMMPVNKATQHQLQYLKKFADWLEVWGNMSEKSLTPQTKLAARQVSLGLVELSTFLLKEKDFEFVLLGQIQSDWIEQHFGWIRQLCGANYLIAVRQVLEAEKTIRLRSLIKFSHCSFKDAAEILTQSQSSFSEAREIAPFEEFLEGFTFEENVTNISDSNILFYIAGFIAAGLRRNMNCEGCVSMVVIDTKMPKMIISEEDLTEDNKPIYEKFIDQLNRGGLTKPSDLLYIMVLHLWQLYSEIVQDETLKSKLLDSIDSKKLFACLASSSFEDNPLTANLLDQTCGNHKIATYLPKISGKLFNTMAKNLVSKENDDIRRAKKRASQVKADRKVKKLQSSAK